MAPVFTLRIYSQFVSSSKGQLWTQKNTGTISQGWNDCWQNDVKNIHMHSWHQSEKDHQNGLNKMHAQWWHQLTQFFKLRNATQDIAKSMTRIWIATKTITLNQKTCFIHCNFICHRLEEAGEAEKSWNITQNDMLLFPLIRFEILCNWSTHSGKVQINTLKMHLDASSNSFFKVWARGPPCLVAYYSHRNDEWHLL